MSRNSKKKPDSSETTEQRLARETREAKENEWKVLVLGIFPDARAFTVDLAAKTIRFEVETEDIPFDTLQKLSETFNTKFINLSHETRQGGYCETCSYEYSVVPIMVWNIGLE